MKYYNLDDEESLGFFGLRIWIDEERSLVYELYNENNGNFEVKSL